MVEFESTAISIVFSGFWNYWKAALRAKKLTQPGQFCNHSIEEYEIEMLDTIGSLSFSHLPKEPHKFSSCKHWTNGKNGKSI